MKTQWKGDAAKAHIDNLGIAHYNLGVTIAKIESISALVRTQVSRMIEAENANGANYPTVSAATVTTGTISNNPIVGESGSAVIVDTEEADQNLESLKGIANQYNEFKSDYDASLTNIFQVWESGAGRADIESYNVKFGKESEEFVRTFDEVIKAYETAIANYKTLQSSPIE